MKQKLDFIEDIINSTRFSCITLIIKCICIIPKLYIIDKIALRLLPGTSKNFTMFIKLLYPSFKTNFILTDPNSFLEITGTNKGCTCKFEIKECYSRKLSIYPMETCYYENHTHHIYPLWENLL